MCDTVALGEERSVGQPAPSKGVLLVVDDEPGPRESLRLMFQGEYQVELARGGFEGVAKATTQPVDVVVLDLRMPDLDGVSVLRTIKEHDPSVEVVMLTAYETVETAKEAVRLGAAYYLNKPFDVQSVRETVRAAFQRRQAAAEMEMLAERLRRENEALQREVARFRQLAATGEIATGMTGGAGSPLGIVAAQLEAIADGLERATDPAQAGRLDPSLLHRVARELERCQRLAQRLLDRQRRSAEEGCPANVEDVLGDLRELLHAHPAARERAIEIASTPPGPALWADVDAGHLMELVTGLCVTALRATSQKGGRVTVAVEGPVSGADEPLLPQGWSVDRLRPASFDPAGSFVRISVFDDGGADTAAALVERTEPDLPAWAEGQARGSDPALYRRQLENAGGQLLVASRPDVGTRRWVYVPHAVGAGPT